MPHPDRHFLRDFLTATSGIGLIVLSGFGMLLNAAVVLFVVVAGLFVLLDPSHAPLFRPWIIVSGIYLVLAVTYLLYRPPPPQITVTVQNRHEIRHMLNVVQQVQPLANGRLLTVDQAVTGQESRYGRIRLLWLHADGQIQFAHVGEFSATLCQRDGFWLWQVVRNGILCAEGHGISEADAKQQIDACLYAESQSDLA